MRKKDDEPFVPIKAIYKYRVPIFDNCSSKPLRYEEHEVKVAVIGKSERSYKVKTMEFGAMNSFSVGQILWVKKRNVRLIMSTIKIDV